MGAQTLEQIAEILVRDGRMLATAESCTGGGIAQLITSLAGSSAWYSYSVVSYSNAAKEKILGVEASTLEQYGAVSEPVAQEMAVGVARLAGAQVTVSVTGIAGPGGGSAEKPVGTVCIGWFVDGKVSVERFLFSGDREQVRAQTIEKALEGVLQRITK